MIEYFASTEKGSRRVKNEDRIMVNDAVVTEGLVCGSKENGFIGVVCDGVGGMGGGEVAAEMTASGFVGYEVDKASAYSLNHYIQEINESVVNAQKQILSCRNMASTVAGIMFWDNRFLAFNVGDTRIYEVKDNSLLLRTKNHTAGDEQSENHQEYQNNVLTRYIGGFGHACKPSITRGCVLGTESYFFICSDGVYKKIPEEKIISIFSDGSSLEEKGRAILNYVNQNGSTDDKSLVLIRYVG